MTRFAGFLLLVLAAAIANAPVGAGDDTQKGKDSDAVFRKLDTNADGKLTKDEFLKMADRFSDREKARDRLGKAFDRLDPNNRGITRQQFRTFLEASQKKKADDAKPKTAS